MGNNNKKKNKHKKQKKNASKLLSDQGEAQDSQEFEHGDDLTQKAEKRPFDENDSDADDKPKRKKKKKQIVPAETDDKKGKKSIRQMKRERHAQRQAEAQFAAKDQLKSQCLSYLSQWKHDRQNWKFMKVKQVWLFKNKFSSSLVPDSSWPVFLEYFESAKGNIKNLLLEDANKVIKQMDEWTESQNKEDTVSAEDENAEKKETEPVQKPDDAAYKRARDIIQCLQE